jgi:hypothetical protein
MKKSHFGVHRLLAVAVLGAMPLVGLACKSKVVGSCDWRPKENRCFDYPDTKAKDDCKGDRVWSDKPCDLAGALGGCETVNGITKWIYPSDTVKSRDDAGTECGSWLEPKR